jgi:hypothetical protein
MQSFVFIVPSRRICRGLYKTRDAGASRLGSHAGAWEPENNQHTNPLIPLIHVLILVSGNPRSVMNETTNNQHTNPLIPLIPVLSCTGIYGIKGLDNPLIPLIHVLILVSGNPRSEMTETTDKRIAYIKEDLLGDPYLAGR